MKIAFIFPGQGAQYVSMGKDFYSSFDQAKKIYDEADRLLGYKLSSIIFEGPEQELTKTKNSQVAIYVNSVAILEVLRSLFPGLQPTVTSGLSLGEYTALYASGRVTFSEGLLLVQKRAEFMNDACEKIVGKMSAVLGLSYQTVKEVTDATDGVWLANCNCLNQIVISGTEKGVEQATLELKEKGAKRVIPLVVHGAFHSGLMQDAQDRLAFYVDQTEIKDSSVSFVMNVPGDFVSSADSIKSYLKDQVTRSVLWEMGIREIEKKGVDVYLEIGCGKTLSGMNKKIKTQAPTISIDKVEDVETLKTFLKDQGDDLC